MSRHPEPLVIFGAGSHARECAQIVADINEIQPRWQLLGFISDLPAPDQAILPAPWLGSLDQSSQFLKAASLMVAVGQSTLRRAVVLRLRECWPACRFATLIHPGAWCARTARIGEGSLVFPGACISSDARIGNHVSINLASTVSHDVVLADYVSLGPGVHLAGGGQVGEAADLGAGVVMRPRTQVGPEAIVGAGAVIVQPIPAACTAVGVPARPLAAPQP